MELHAHVPSEEASELREVPAVRLVQDDAHDAAGSPERVEQEAQDLGSDRKRTHAQDLPAAREDHLPELASDRLGPFVDPKIWLGLPDFRRSALLQSAHYFGGGNQIIAFRLARFFRDDSRGTGSVPGR